MDKFTFVYNDKIDKVENTFNRIYNQLQILEDILKLKSDITEFTIGITIGIEKEVKNDSA